jgi:uncharacterized membrane protein YbhN (UPF0104 family)
MGWGGVGWGEVGEVGPYTWSPQRLSAAYLHLYYLAFAMETKSSLLPFLPLLTAALVLGTINSIPN